MNINGEKYIYRVTTHKLIFMFAENDIELDRIVKEYKDEIYDVELVKDDEKFEAKTDD